MTKKPAKKTAKKPKLPTAKDYLVGLQAMKGKKEDDMFASFADGLFDSTVRERIPSGCLALDRLTGGGWPVGRIVEVAAWEGVGKSTLLDQSLAQVQRMNGVGCLIDTEGARDEPYMITLGIDVKALISCHAETIEGAFVGIDKLLDMQEMIKAGLKGEEPPLLLIVWDAIGGTPTKAEKEGSAEDIHVMEAARAIKRNFRRICLRLPPLRTCLVVANHFYRTMGPFAALKTYGGSGIQYFSSLRLRLTRKAQLKIGSGENAAVVGHVVEGKINKTRIGKPQPPVEAGLVWGSGLDNSYTLFEWGRTHGVAEDHKWVSQRGAWYYLHLPDGKYETFQRGFAGFGELMTEHPAVYQKMAEQYLEGE